MIKHNEPYILNQWSAEVLAYRCVMKQLTNGSAREVSKSKKEHIYREINNENMQSNVFMKFAFQKKINYSMY
jgi:hypothetical protein